MIFYVKLFYVVVSYDLFLSALSARSCKNMEPLMPEYHRLPLLLKASLSDQFLYYVMFYCSMYSNIATYCVLLHVVCSLSEYCPSHSLPWSSAEMCKFSSLSECHIQTFHDILHYFILKIYLKQTASNTVKFTDVNIQSAFSASWSSYKPTAHGPTGVMTQRSEVQRA